MQATNPVGLTSITETPSMEGSTPALPAEPGTLNATLPDTPGWYTLISLSFFFL